MSLDRLKATGCIFILFLGVFALSSAAQAGPEDGRIVNGSGSISQSGTHTDIRQNSDFLATHWGSFNIAAHESVQAHQPGSTSRLLIRVDGGGATNIAGNYTSNGITILENRNGVQFSRGAIVNVGGLLATSSRISGVADANWQLNGTGGEVVNHGQIVAGAGGAILAAVKVQNTGDITAKGGDVALGAGSSFTVDFAGSMVGFEVKKAADGASVVNTGEIEAQGGIVSLSAQEAQAVRTNVVSVGGVVKATRIERRGGVVYLSGGTQGIAEVSGDVSASDKVQTTGEYIVVKEGALLKAPEILVGGDFQGGGDVPTSRRTLVERGALLNAGKDGRVIVWSDETTWFNGNITAPGGFAEVSGKETLASVNLAGIDVGELLLDPTRIFIAAIGMDTFTGSVVAERTDEAVTFGVSDINDYTGNLTLAASGFIQILVEIDKTMGNLTLESFILQIDADITVAGDLTLSASDTISLTIASNNLVTLTGRAVTINGPVSGDNPNNDTGDKSFTITASGNITINGNINVGTRTLTLTAGNGAGAGNIMNGGTAPTLRAGSVRLTQDGVFADNLFAIDPGTPSLTLTTGAAQEVRNWMASGAHDLNLMVGGDLGISTGNVDGINNGTGNLTIAAGGVVAVGAAINKPTGNLTLIAGGNLRVNANIDNGTNTLTLTAGMGGTGDLVACSTCTLTAGTLNLMQNGAFDGDAPYMIAANALNLTTNAAQTVQGWMTDGDRALSLTSGGVLTIGSNLDTGTGNLTLSGTSIALGANVELTGAAIRLTGAITVASSSNNNLTINASGLLTLNSGINLGSGILTITADERINVPNNGTAIAAMAINITFTDSVVQTPAAGFTLAGGMATFTNANFSPTPAYTYNRGCTIAVCILGSGSGFEAEPELNAATSITIEAGTNALTFSGTGAITITSPIVSITAGSIDIGGRALMITASGGTLTLTTAITGTGNITLTGASIALSGAAAITTTGDITLTGTSIALSSAATLTGAAITITAPTIDIGADRALTITASGALTLATVGMITGMGTASLTLTGATIAGLSTTLTLNVPVARLELTDEDSSFPEEAPFAVNSRITTLNIATNEPAAAPLEYRGWMAPPAGTNRNLTISSGGISIGSTAINLGTGNLTLNGQSGTLLTNAAGLTITAGNVRLSGTNLIGRDGVDVLLFVVMASGDITISSNISLPAARVELRADADGMDGGMITATAPRNLAASSVFMQQMGAFADDLFLTGVANTLVSGAVELRVTTAVDQVIHPWMAGLGGSTFSLRGVEGVVLNSITIPAAADFGTTAIDLQAATINLGAAAALTGGAISLTGEITAASSSNNNLNIRASGVLTLNSDINLGTGDLTLTSSGSGINLGAPITLAADNITFTGAIASANNNNLTLSATTLLTLNSDLDTGTGNLTLNLGTMRAAFTNVRSLRGNAVTIAGAMGITSTDGNLVISALGNLMVNTNISLGTGANTLRLRAGRGAGQTTGVISFTPNTVELRASRFTFTQDGELFVNGLPAVIQNAEGAMRNEAQSELITRIVYDGTATQSEVDWANILPNTVSLGTGTDYAVPAADLTAGVLEAAVSITLDAGTGVLTFEGTDDITLRAPTITITAGTINLGADRTLTITAAAGALTLNLNATATITGTGTASITIDAGTNALIFGGTRPITVSAPTVTITAGDINIGSRALTITASNGSLTVNADIRAGAASTGAIMLAAINGALTLGDDSQIVADAAVLTLSSTGTNSELVSCATCFFDAAELRLTQTTVFGGGDLSPYILSSVSILNITTSAPQTVQGWMIAADRTFSLTTTGMLTLNNQFNAGNNGDVTLTGMGGIVLGGTFTQISARNITLRGAISTDRPSVILTAEGVITIHNDIDAGTGTLTLTAGADISNGGAETAPTWTASAVSLSLTQGGVFGSTAPFTFDGTTLASLTIQTAVAQTAHSWMGVSGSAVSLTAGGDITIGGNIDVGTGSLTLIASGNIVSGNTLSVLTADTVNLELTGSDSSLTTRLFVAASRIGTLNITTQADQDYRVWMRARGRNLMIDSQGSISIGSANINLGTGDLTLRARGNILASVPRPVLTADTVNFELTGTSSFSRARLFAAASPITTLNITTAANQTYRVWMAPPAGTNRNLSIDALGFIITINAAAINLGTGDLTLSARLHDYTHASGLTIRVGDFSHSGTFQTADLVSISTPLLVFADGNITLDTAFGLSNRLELRADADGDGMGMITSTPGVLAAGSVLLQQAGAFGATSLFSSATVSGAATFLITAPMIDQTIHPWMTGLGDGNFSLRGVGVALTSITTEAALTRTGTVELQATTITLGGALTGVSVALRTNTITGDSANLVAIHASTGEITATGADGTGRPALATDVTSFSLTRSRTFGGRGSLPFTLTDLSAITAITLSTRSPQIVLSWMIADGRNLTITSASTVRVNAAIGGSGGRNLGDGNLTLTSTGGILRILVGISITGDLTLSGNTGINLNSGVGAKTLRGGTVTLSGNARSNRALTLTAMSGALTLSGGIALTGMHVLSLSGSGGIALGGALTLTTGDSIMFGNAVTGAANLTITTRGTLTLNNNITLSGTTSIIDLESGQDAITGLAILTAPTVRLRQVAAFDLAPPFNFSTTPSLELTTEAEQVVHNWMIVASGRNLTVESSDRVVVDAAIGPGLTGRDLGGGDLTLRSTGGGVRILADITTGGAITLDGATGINTSGAARTLSGEGITLVGRVRSVGEDVIINANDGILSLNGNVDTRNNATSGDLTLEGATIQIGRAASTLVNTTRILLRGGAITLTSAMGIQIGRFSGSGAFSTNGGVANLTVTASGVLTIAGNITVASTAASGGDIVLTGGSIAFGGAARTITGTAITLSGAATGTADLTITASGTLTINNDIGIGANTLTLTSGVGAIVNGGTVTLDAITVSLAQDAAFGTTEPFAFGSTITSLALATEAAQDVLDWMIVVDRNLTVTSAGIVLVDAAIGGSGGRNLGNGSLTLMSTGGAVRILANISTMGDLTLSGVTGGINLRGGAVGVRTLSGGTVMLSGAARSNRDLTINATNSGGALTLNGDINTGTSALSLSGGGGITLGGALTLTGGAITLNDAAVGIANLTITASEPLTLNNNITLTGTSILDLRSRQGAITGTGTLFAQTVRLRQVDEFGIMPPPFNFGTTGSLELTTDAAQDVHNWMIALNRNLTVTSADTVRVGAAIGATVVDRNLGTGNITLVSTGGLVRIFADITTGGNITLNGATGINFNNRAAKTLSGAIITLTGVVVSNRDLTLTASGTLRFNNNITLNGVRALSLTSTGGDVRILGNITTGGDLTLNGNTGIDLRSGAAKTFSGANITLTGVVVSNRAVTLTASGILRLNNNIALTGTRALSLSGSGGITLGSALTTLSGGAITLRGAATGTADLTITARGTLTINNNINIGTNALTLTSGAGAISNGGAVRVLTASTVSLSQEAAFVGARPFNFDFGSTVGSLELTTTVNQDVFNWMIEPDTDLTVTSVGIVRVAAAIGGSGGRNLGDGNLTLESTGGAVRILANISTGGGLTLNGNTGINLNSGVGAKTLSGGVVTLTGAARSNRALTIMATGGALTINNNINIGTADGRILTLTATGGFVVGSDVDLTAGEYAFPPAAICTADSTGPRCTR